jgi:hypothetical protein
MNKKGYTVFAVLADYNSRRLSSFVEAETPEEAEQKVIRESADGLIVAGVVEGRVGTVGSRCDAAIVPIQGRGYETSVARLTVTYLRVRFPFRCPSCRADLCKAEALYQWDWWDHVWLGRLPRSEYVAEDDHVGVTVNHDVGARSPTDFSGTVVAAIVQCARCKRELWNGYEEVAA